MILAIAQDGFERLGHELRGAMEAAGSPSPKASFRA